MSENTGPDGHQVIFDGAGIGDFCPETSLLENFERLNIDIPNLCRKGRCGCCKLLL
ncbi:2Fe-2S iron-sulfur cluster-binding protein, partial [Serratia marcescens]